MRFNKQELIALSSQTSQNFDREGVLVLKERQDGFFRRSEGCSIRWFRLRGNLLFYLKGPEPWYEPMGVIVLGQHQVKVLPPDDNGYWPFQIIWESGVVYRIATFHESERTLWLKAIELAAYHTVHNQMASLKDKLNAIRPTMDIRTYRQQKSIILDLNEVPLCELALSCDNLLCNAYGKPPSPMAEIFVKNSNGPFIKYGNTEFISMSSNPTFTRTILFRGSDGLTGDTVVRIVIHDVLEPTSHTTVPMGSTAMKLTTIQEAQRLRVALCARDNKTIGFVTVNGWSLEPAYVNASPSRTSGNGLQVYQKVQCHRRSQSLPPRLGMKVKYPTYGNIFKQNFVNGHQVTYRFHSGLGGDIAVHELMAEPKLCYRLPLQLIDMFIQREQEYIQELLLVGEICTHWKPRQTSLLATHIALLKHYFYSKRSLLNIKHNSFKSSSMKEEACLEFAPVNLHLQRMWIHNDTLNKTGFHDVITVGAFAAHTHKAERTGGLITLVQQLKDTSSSKAELNSITSRIQAEYENLLMVRRLRDEIKLDMDKILLVLQAKQVNDLPAIVEAVIKKVTKILSMWDPTVLEETLSLIGFSENYCIDELHKQALKTISSLTEKLSRTCQVAPQFVLSRESLKEMALSEEQALLAESKESEQGTSETGLNFQQDHFDAEKEVFTQSKMNTDKSVAGNLEQASSVACDIDKTLESELSEIPMLLQSDKESTVNVPLNKDTPVMVYSDNVSFANYISKTSVSVDTESSNPDHFHENSMVEANRGIIPVTPVQVDRKHLAPVNPDNFFWVPIKPAPSLSLKQSCRIASEFRSSTMFGQVSYNYLFDLLNKNLKEVSSTIDANQKKPLLFDSCQLDKPTRKSNLSFLQDVQTKAKEALSSVVEAVMIARTKQFGRLSVREVRTIEERVALLQSRVCAVVRWLRLSHGAVRLRCESPQWLREQAALQTRRDACFSQALTTVTAGLVCWLCSTPHDIIVKILSSSLGPLSAFEGLLSLYANEKAMWGDMVVAIEDLQAVQFTLSKVGHSNTSIPHLSGTRNALIVFIPVSDTLYSKFTQKEHLSFTITAVFFNIGINEKATLAEAQGDLAPQFLSNSDNMDRLDAYYQKYNNVFRPDHSAPNRASSRTRPLGEVMENLRVEIQKKDPKNVEVLQLASLATRTMNGLSFTSCKSAKDRTGMSVTLAQCALLSTEYHLADYEMRKALDVMRSEGCRLENTMKNIGVRKYAFSKKQLMSLPEDYRPPAGTYGATKT